MSKHLTQGQCSFPILLDRFDDFAGKNVKKMVYLHFVRENNHRVVPNLSPQRHLIVFYKSGQESGNDNENNPLFHFSCEGTEMFSVFPSPPKGI